MSQRPGQKGRPEKLALPHFGAANTGNAQAALPGMPCKRHPTLSSISIGDVPDMMFDVQVNGKPAIAFVDPGASNLFMSRETAAKFDLEVEEQNTVDVGVRRWKFIHLLVLQA